VKAGLLVLAGIVEDYRAATLFLSSFPCCEAFVRADPANCDPRTTN
jgi:hypothetical protein